MSVASRRGRLDRRHSFPSLHFRPDDGGELFGGGQFSFQFTGQFRLQGVGGDADGVGFRAEGILLRARPRALTPAAQPGGWLSRSARIDFHVVLFRAEDDADGGLVAGAALLVV